MSFEIQTADNQVFTWSTELLEEVSGYFQALFSFHSPKEHRKDGRIDLSGIPQPYPLEEIEGSTLSQIADIVKSDRYPLLDSEEELEDLSEAMDFLLIPSDSQELRILTGRMDWLADFPNVKLSFDENNERIVIFNSNSEPEFKIYIWSYGIDVSFWDEEQETLRLKEKFHQYGITDALGSSWGQHLLYGLVGSYLHSELFLQMREKFYSDLEVYFGLFDQKRIRNFQGYLFSKNLDFPRFNINFIGYHHPFYTHIRIVLLGGITFIFHFHSTEVRDQWLKKYPDLKLSNKFPCSIYFEKENIFPPWEILKKENCLALTPTVWDEFRLLHVKLEKGEFSVDESERKYSETVDSSNDLKNPDDLIPCFQPEVKQAMGSISKRSQIFKRIEELIGVWYDPPEFFSTSSLLPPYRLEPYISNKEDVPSQAPGLDLSTIYPTRPPSSIELIRDELSPLDNLEKIERSISQLENPGRKTWISKRKVKKLLFS